MVSLSLSNVTVIFKLSFESYLHVHVLIAVDRMCTVYVAHSLLMLFWCKGFVLGYGLPVEMCVYRESCSDWLCV